MNMLNTLDNRALAKEIGRRLTHLRLSARLKQEDLARKAGISCASLYRMEKGIGGIRLDSFLSVLRSLGVLNSLSVMLPEPSLTPLQMAELEKKKKGLPKRVRAVPVKTRHRWGDERA